LKIYRVKKGLLGYVMWFEKNKNVDVGRWRVVKREVNGKLLLGLECKIDDEVIRLIEDRRK